MSHRPKPDRQPATGDFPEGHPDPDGAAWLFELLTDPAHEAFQAFAEDYYETAADLEAVRHVYSLRPLDRALITSLNPTASVKDVVQEAMAIGYSVDPALSPKPADITAGRQTPCRASDPLHLGMEDTVGAD